MVQQNFSRRKVLRTGAATAGLLATGSLAGCGGIPFLGGGAGYTDWLPAPDEYDGGDHARFSYQKPQTVTENEDNFDEDVFDNLEFDNPTIDVDYDEMTEAFGMGPFAVFDGNYEESTVVEQLEDDDEGTFEEDDEVSGYRIFIPEDADEPSTAFAVDGSRVIRGNAAGGDNAVEIIELILETKNGEGTRYASDNEDFQLLTDELGSGTWVSGGTQEETDEARPQNGVFENQLASGATLTLNGETTDVKYVRVLDSEDDYDDGDVEDWIEDTLEERDAEVQDASQSASGRAVIVTGTIDTDELTTSSIYGF